MSVCCISSCRNNFNNNRNVHYYRFPSYGRRDDHAKQMASLKQRMAWIIAVAGKSNVTVENVCRKRICSAHFVSGKKADCMDRANLSWVPTIWQLDHANHNIGGRNDIDKTDDPDTTPNLAKLLSDQTAIETETVDEVISASMQMCDEIMNLAEKKV